MILTAAMLLAAGLQGWFPFVIPWNDASKTPTDLSYLNVMPAGRNGRIVSRNGHFYEAASGNRVRFMAVNMVAAAAFPSHHDADLTAAHLAKLGVNLVRFHHLQNPWGVETGGSIWKKGRLYLELDPVQLDKLDYLFAALKKNGIYSNLNLQTTRSYLPEMGFPESVKDIPFEMDKRIDKVDRKMIGLQKQYARDLLARTNPYTGLAYKDDPSLAFVEINNENSLVSWPWESSVDVFGGLPEYFRQEVVSGWNTWLAKRYGNDDGVRQAWAKGLEKPGPSLLPSGAAWTWENQSNGDVKFDSPNPDETRQYGNGVAPSIRTTVNSNAGPDWHVQIHLVGLDLNSTHAYTLKFKARCSHTSSIGVSATLDEADWHNIGLTKQVHVDPDWRSYSIPFTAVDARPNHNRVGFVLGAMRGTLEIEDLTLSTGIDPGPILGGSVAKGDIPIPGGGIQTRTDDFYRFLTQTETAYSNEMRAFLRKDLGIKANLVDTQVAWGGISSLIREKGSDYADNHSYWQHPSFPGKAWDMANWVIANTPMVSALAKHSDGLTELAKFRFAGKPYTISEYNHPAPSDFRVEMMPLLATLAALQDWDGFYLFEYGVFGEGQKNDQMASFFDVGVDPVRAGFMPSAALIFREGFVKPLTGVNRAVVSSKDAEAVKGNPWAGRDADPLNYRLELTTDEAPALVKGEGPDRKFLNFEGGSCFALATAKAAVLVGQLFKEIEPPNLKVGQLELGFHFDRSAPTFGAITCVALRSGGYLLTIGSRAENQGIHWNATRTSIGEDWGHGPVLAEGVGTQLTIQGGASKLRLWALDPTGKRKREVTEGSYGQGQTFHIGPADETIWYELATK